METRKLMMIVVVIVAIAALAGIFYTTDIIGQVTGNRHRGNTTCTPEWQCKEYETSCRSRDRLTVSTTFKGDAAPIAPGPVMTFTAKGDYLDMISVPREKGIRNIKYMLVDANDNSILTGDRTTLASLANVVSLNTGEEYRLFPTTFEEYKLLSSMCQKTSCRYDLFYNKKTTPGTIPCKEVRDKNRCGATPPTDLSVYTKECTVCVPAWECSTFTTTCTAAPTTMEFDASASYGSIYDNPDWIWGSFTTPAPTNSIKTSQAWFVENGGARQPLPSQFDTMNWQWIWYYEAIGGPGEQAAITTGSTATGIAIPQGRTFITRAYGDAASVSELVAFCNAAGRSCGFSVVFDSTAFTSNKICTAVRDTSKCGVGFFGSLGDYNVIGSCGIPS